MYEYKNEKPGVFEPENQKTFLGIRDNCYRLCKLAGCVRMDKAWGSTNGRTWMQMACVDRLVELGEFKEVTAPGATEGQYRIFVVIEGTA